MVVQCAGVTGELFRTPMQCSGLGETLLHVAVVTCDLWLSVTYSYKMIHMDDSQVGMWVPSCG